MPKGIRFPNVVRELCLSFKKEGMTHKEIQGRVYQTLKNEPYMTEKPSTSYVSHAVGKQSSTGKVRVPEKKHKENPRKVIKEDKRKELVRLLRYNHRIGRQHTPKQFIQQLEVKCCEKTMRRAIKSVPGAVARKPLQVLQLTPPQKTKRLRFAKKALKDQNPRFWKRVVFADEKKFSLSGPDSSPPVWTLRERRAIRLRHPCTRLGVMVWMAIGPEGIIGPEWVRKTVTAVSYEAILEKYRSQLSRVFMDDAAAAHRADLVRQFFSKYRIRRVCDVVFNAPKLVEINIIENLWSVIQRRLFQSGMVFETPEALFLGIQRVVDAMRLEKEDRQLYQTYTDAIPKRLKQIKANRGGMITKK